MIQPKKHKAITFNKRPEFGEKPKVFAYEDNKWLPFQWSEMVKMTLQDFLDFKLRFMVEFTYKDSLTGNEKKIRICSHKEDVIKVAVKYPDDFTLNLMSVLRIFKHNLEENDGETIEKIFFCVSELNAEIV